MQPHLHVDAIDVNGNRTNVLGKNYGTVTNKEFFEKHEGNWGKLLESKVVELEEITVKPQSNE